MNRIRKTGFGLKCISGILLLVMAFAGSGMAQTQETEKNQVNQTLAQDGVQNVNRPSNTQNNNADIQNRRRAQEMAFQWTRKRNPNQFQPGITGVSPSRLLSERQIRKNAERMALEYTRNRGLRTDKINSASLLPGAQDVPGAAARTPEENRRMAQEMIHASSVSRNPWGGTEEKLANTRRTGEQIRATALSQTAVSTSTDEQKMLEARLSRMQEVRKEREKYKQSVKKNFENFQRTRLKPLKYNGSSSNFSAFNQTFRPIARR